jgi:CheY-like chemotaxis protein
MNGLEAARRIRAKEAELGRRHTPIVALTGNVMSQYVADYRAAGMDVVVAKPIEAATLLRTIVEVVAQGDLKPLERRQA